MSEPTTYALPDEPEGQGHYGQPVTPEDYAARQDALNTHIRNARRRTA